MRPISILRPPLSPMELPASLGVVVVESHPAAGQLVEVDEVAAALHVSRYSIYRWATEGRIPSVRAGRKVRFELDAVVAALRSEVVAPPSRPRATPPMQSPPPRLLPPAPAPEQPVADRLRAVLAATRGLGTRR